MIHWEATLALGHEELDTQHRELLRLANQLLAAHQGRTAQDLPAAIRALINYSAEHFLYEERLMAESGYAKAELHSEHHGIVLSRLHRFSEGLLRHDGAQTGERVAQFLKNWIVSHLTCFDRDLARHLAAAAAPVEAPAPA
jgi:hemerythrin-like metal-binding protein